MYVKHVLPLLLPFSIPTVISHPEPGTILSSRKSSTWIATYDLSDEKCTAHNPYDNTQGLPKDVCVQNQGTGNLATGGREGGSWGARTIITGYDDGSCVLPVWNRTRKDIEEGRFCWLMSDLPYWGSMMGSGDEPEYIVPNSDYYP